MSTPEFDKDLTFLVLKFLHENKYYETLHKLEQQSGLYFNLNHFKKLTENGKWDEVRSYLSGFTKMEDNELSRRMFSQIRNQERFEALDKLGLLGEHAQLSNFGDTKSARAILLEEIKELIQRNPKFVGKINFPIMENSRLVELLKQGVKWQHLLCKNPSPTPEFISLFYDHSCDQPNPHDPSSANINPLLGSSPNAGSSHTLDAQVAETTLVLANPPAVTHPVDCRGGIDLTAISNSAAFTENDRPNPHGPSSAKIPQLGLSPTAGRSLISYAQMAESTPVPTNPPALTRPVACRVTTGLDAVPNSATFTENDQPNPNDSSSANNPLLGFSPVAGSSLISNAQVAETTLVPSNPPAVTCPVACKGIIAAISSSVPFREIDQPNRHNQSSANIPQLGFSPTAGSSFIPYAQVANPPIETRPVACTGITGLTTISNSATFTENDVNNSRLGFSPIAGSSSRISDKLVAETTPDAQALEATPVPTKPTVVTRPLACRGIIGLTTFSDSAASKEINEIIKCPQDGDVSNLEKPGVKTGELEDKPEAWKLTEINDSSQCQFLRLSSTSSKISGLTYTNAGNAIIVLAANLNLLWKWPHTTSSGLATTTVSPHLWQPSTRATMLNDVTNINPKKAVSCFALSKKDAYLVSTSGSQISVYSTVNFKTVATFLPPPPAVTFLAFYPPDNNIIAIGRDDATIEIRNVHSDRFICVLRTHMRRITGLAFSTPLGILVSAGAEAQICVWRTDLWRKIKAKFLVPPPERTLERFSDTRVQFHQDQVHFLVVHKSQIALYEANNNLACKKQWAPYAGTAISHATFSCDSQLIYVCLLDATICIITTASFKMRCRINPVAYLLSNDISPTLYPTVVAAHPSIQNQFAIGMTDGDVVVFEPHVSEGRWGKPLPNECFFGAEQPWHILDTSASRSSVKRAS